ncbi:MAG: nucleotidyl transferase AbiEii/AbiGii toxin family protein [Planctomycetes bacterium]|nr:nucleotidyl transferase AbiEii/AbiGii toxin family protein [Planctomycetota bacterium]
MIPRAQITAWRQTVPWADDGQVEQDLVLSRALVELFPNSGQESNLVLRGGTALQKLLLVPPARYSEDIDLVQRRPEPIGDCLDRIRGSLDPWLGEARYKQGRGGVTLAYRFQSESLPVRPLRLKIEINTREHFSVHELAPAAFQVSNPWFSGQAMVLSYGADELLGTKMRALYQRRKGRDLFDLWLALDRGLVRPERVVDCFGRYMAAGGTPVGREDYATNLMRKAEHPGFRGDVRPLLASGQRFDFDAAVERVARELVSRLPE